MIPTEPAGVIFDFGGVLWNMRWDVCHEIEQAHGLERGAVFSTLYRSETWYAIERGLGDPEAWREEAHRALEARAGRALPRLHDAWRATQEEHAGRSRKIYSRQTAGAPWRTAARRP